jgi:hypothetical protein
LRKFCLPLRFSELLLACRFNLSADGGFSLGCLLPLLFGRRNRVFSDLLDLGFCLGVGELPIAGVSFVQLADELRIMPMLSRRYESGDLFEPVQRNGLIAQRAGLAVVPAQNLSGLGIGLPMRIETDDLGSQMGPLVVDNACVSGAMASSDAMDKRAGFPCRNGPPDRSPR